jgi:predicted amidophosphoribosyltransferase
VWPLVVAVLAWTAWRWRRDRRPPPGCCQRCGYNLTGNVTGRCPECGTPTRKPKSAGAS